MLNVSMLLCKTKAEISVCINNVCYELAIVHGYNINFVVKYIAIRKLHVLAEL